MRPPGPPSVSVLALIGVLVVSTSAGSYVGMVVIQQPLRLWGRCAPLVELTGGSEYEFSLLLGPGAASATASWCWAAPCSRPPR